MSATSAVWLILSCITVSIATDHYDTVGVDIKRTEMDETNGRPFLLVHMSVPDNNNSLTARHKRNPMLGGALLGCAGTGGIELWDQWADNGFSNINWSRVGRKCAQGAILGAVGGHLAGPVGAVAMNGWNWVQSRVGRRKRSYCYGRKKRFAEEIDCAAVEFAFEQSDVNGDGRLELDELRIDPAMTYARAVELFSMRDTDGSGYLEPNEVHPCLTKHHRNPHKKHHRIKRCSYNYGYQPYQTYTIYI